MLREQIQKTGLGEQQGFRWRGGEVSRIEGFSDAVFAFAVTLLVVSLEVPRNFEELLGTMRGFLAFGICFTFLVWIWYEHYIFFRRYGLQDGFTIVLNAILLFVVLFYIYPLKFLFTALVALFFNLVPPGGAIEIKANLAPKLMIIYSLGFLAIFVIYLLLYLHAYRKRAALELNAIELVYARSDIYAALINIGVALLSILLASSGGERSSFWAGVIYAINGPLHTIRGVAMGKRIEKLQKQALALASPAG